MKVYESVTGDVPVEGTEEHDQFVKDKENLQSAMILSARLANRLHSERSSAVLEARDGTILGVVLVVTGPDAKAFAETLEGLQ